MQERNNEERCSCDLDRPLSFAATVDLHGDVSECCCTFDEMERINAEIVHPLLKRVVATPFFAHFKIDLCSDCELWTDAPLCVLRDCGVCECDEPPAWASQVEWMPSITGPDAGCEHLDDQVVTTVDLHVLEEWPSSSGLLSFLNDDSMVETESNHAISDTAVVVDLRLNPERYTGYNGPSAEKVWNAIHSENCFQQENATDGGCSLTSDQRVYNRILSGLHSSISLHIAHSYCLEMDPNKIAECKTWGPNVTVALERVLNHKDRMENLYVAFAVLLRAVQKVGIAITSAVPTEDDFFAESLKEWKDHLLPQLQNMVNTCPLMFDETSLSLDGEGLGNLNRLELQRRFRHLQQIMQCVGCDRCKLWGTLQTLGIGTALRVLLAEDSTNEIVELSRQEAVALVHTLERFSSALVYATELAATSQEG
ncbi:endoplasmic reticulum oxidoreductin [Nitzschia inconspicua]|uniref:Endoplasmic reticulum oxidoreductin n=1 Tax=Nitzschia inconspicua TaxID=303405 RepID=A0A9K3M2J8_9STRA|nr:endoplasmic reticulum oxidoreductin [Nitzschia inconspicua]